MEPGMGPGDVAEPDLAQVLPGQPTSSTRRRSSFCSSMRRCRWCRRCLMCASGSRCCCCCSCCCCFKASELLLFSCWSRRNSRRSVDSPGTFMMELGQGGTWRLGSEPSHSPLSCLGSHLTRWLTWTRQSASGHSTLPSLGPCPPVVSQPAALNHPPHLLPIHAISS